MVLSESRKRTLSLSPALQHVPETVCQRTAVASLRSPAVVFEEPLDWQVRLRKLNVGSHWRA